jgi:WD40 repeat protein
VGGSKLLTWDIASAQATRSIGIDDAWGVQLDPTASLAYVTDPSEGTVVKWNLEGSGPYLRLTSSHPALASVGPGFLLPAGDGVHFADFATGVNLVNTVTGAVSPAPRAGDSGWFTPGSWRPDARRFALGTEGGRVQVFDASGHLRTEARAAVNGISGVDYGSDGTSLAVSDLTGRVALLDASTLTRLAPAARLPGPVAQVTLAPNGYLAFVVTTTDPLTPGVPPPFTGWALLDLRTGSTLRTGTLPESDPTWDDFSPDDTHVAVSFQSGRMLIIDTRTGSSTDAPLPAHRSEEMLWVTYSPDGSRVLTGDESGVELWDTTSGEVLDSVPVPGGRLVAGQFRPGTKTVTILDYTGHVYAWNTSAGRALDYACRMAGRDITADEWRTYVGDGHRVNVCPP